MKDEEKSKEQLILELKEARHQVSVLQENQEYLDKTFSKLPIGVAILVGEDFEYFRINQPFADMNGLPVEEHLGKTVEEVLPYASNILPNLRKVRETGQAMFNREFSAILPKNPEEVRHLMDWYFPITVAGRSQAVGVVVIDITERVKIEEKLRFSDEILENIAEGVFLVRTKDGIIVYTNSQFEKMCGYEPNEMIGQHVSIVHAPGEKDPEDTARKIIEILTMEGTWSGEVHNIKKDGTLFWCHATVSTFEHSSYGTVWLSVQEDISELKKTQTQLIQLARLASLGEMASGISHELNQPLGIIGLEAELDLIDLEKGEYENISESLKKIIAQVDRSALVINHLKTFGRDGSSVDSQETHINALIENAFILINEQLRLHNIKVDKKLATDLPHIQCNRPQIEQVLTNLLINSREAMKSTSSKQIWVRSSQEDGRIIIEVEDTGVGIPEAQLTQVFDPFFTTNKVGKGTGLGLSISYGIIQNHGGSLNVVSHVGKGTTFRIELPITNINHSERKQ